MLPPFRPCPSLISGAANLRTTSKENHAPSSRKASSASRFWHTEREHQEMNAVPNPVPAARAQNETLLALLVSSRDRFLASFADVTEQDARMHPAEGRWSVLDTIEHLIV